MSITIRHPIDGTPLTIDNPLLAEHVEVGRVLWYSGFMVMSSWDCPATITEVDAAKRMFRVRSLDDMKVQNPWYEFDVSEYSPSSRLMMRIPTAEEVKTFLDERAQYLEEDVPRKKNAAHEAESALATFKEMRTKVGL